jgi:hypothetical protein
MAYDRQLYVNAVASRYGFDQRGIQILYDPTLDPLIESGLTRQVEGGRIIRIGPGAFDTSDNLLREATVADTIAHEMVHAENYLKGLSIVDENDAVNAGIAMRNFILSRCQ